MAITSKYYTYERASYIMHQVKEYIEDTWDKSLDDWNASNWEMIHHEPRESPDDTYVNSWGVAFRPPESWKHKVTSPVLKAVLKARSRYQGGGIEWSPEHECFFLTAARSGKEVNAAPEGFPVKYYDDPESEEIPEVTEDDVVKLRKCDRCGERTEHKRMDTSICGVEHGFMKTTSKYACLECGLRHNTRCS